MRLQVRSVLRVFITAAMFALASSNPAAAEHCYIPTNVTTLLPSGVVQDHSMEWGGATLDEFKGGDVEKSWEIEPETGNLVPKHIGMMAGPPGGRPALTPEQPDDVHPEPGLGHKNDERSPIAEGAETWVGQNKFIALISPISKTLSVFFKGSEDNLSDDYYNFLDKNIIFRMKLHIGDQVSLDLKQVSIIGFADSIGTPEDNLELSRNRAENVALDLVSMGIDKDIICADGVGESANSGNEVESDENWRYRRVDLHFLYGG